ncbi:MAG TPA: hypothetical protein VNK04_02960 [Gemmataceae bacterium]|nr:hypothetical protein [Gemmataceae bacterium]
MRRALLVCLLGGCCLAVGGTVERPQALAQPVQPVPAAIPKNFDIRLVRVGINYQGIRFKPATGETWQIGDGRWERLGETGPVPPGDYDIILVANDEDFSALRFDYRSGTAWQLRNRKWVKIEEPR